MYYHFGFELIHFCLIPHCHYVTENVSVSVSLRRKKKTKKKSKNPKRSRNPNKCCTMYSPDRLFGEALRLLLRGVRERLLLSATGLRLGDGERLGDRIFSATFSFGNGDGERLRDFEDRSCVGDCISFISSISFDSSRFGDAETDRFDASSEWSDLLISLESFNGEPERDLASEPLRLLDLETPFSGSLLSGLIGVSGQMKVSLEYKTSFVMHVKQQQTQQKSN